MIESNIVSWLDLGDSMQSLDVYGKKRLVSFFHFIRVLVSFKNVTVFCFIVLKFFFFLQIFMLNVILIDDTSDSTIYILNYIKNILFIHNLITSAQSYKIFIYINTVLTTIEILSMIYLIISISFGTFYLKLPIHLLNIINVLLMDYLIGPIVQTSLLSTHCIGGSHKYLQVECYKHWQHIVFVVISMFNILFFVMLSIGLSIYYNEIGSINETKATSRINCNYELYSNIAKIIMFILSYFVKTYTNNDKVYVIIVQTSIFITSLVFVFYVYKAVLFDDNRINITILFGWAFISWSTLVLGVKTVLGVADTTLFHFIGWAVIAIIIFLLREYKEEYLLTDFNIFEAKNLKEIELFKQKLLSLMSERSLKSKTLLVGIVKKFDEFAKGIPELEEKFSKLSTNEHLKKKYNFDSALSILSIIYAIYDHHLDKSLLKNDILLTMCYYLINKFKNATFAISLCSKIKVTNHIQTYFKYILMEEIKENLVNKLSKSNNKESIKHVQIGSVILYNIYMDLFKIKIYDAACNQIDYFDILRNNLTNTKTTENFLKIGEDILRLRKEILKLWEKIIELNPFSDESERDYMLYLETILQDDILARTEAKRYSTLKTNKLPERNNIYHSMFVRESSTIILIDGYSSNGKILYTTPNFPGMFSFTGKEILNMSVDDLLPNVIQTFHKDLVDNAIKYSNINVTFKTQKDMLLKGKTGGIFNVKLFVKCVPNLSLGLIYMTQITKIQDHNFLIILDKDFRINGLTDLIAQRGADYTMSNNYGLTQGLYGHHVSLVLPEILLQMESKNNEFYIPKSDIDLKGSLYPVSPWKELDAKAEMVLDKIKQCGRLGIEEDSKCTIQDYDELMKEISGKYIKPFSVFFKIVTRTFLDGKHKYHRIYITNDLIALNENTHSNHSNVLTNTLSKKLRKNNNNMNMNNESKATSKDDVKESAKQIKLRIGGTHGSEGKGLLDDDKKDDNMKKEGNDIEQHNSDDDDNRKSNDDQQQQQHQQQNQPGNNFSKPSSAKSSLFTKSSVDSANFNKLKNGILDKKEVAAIQIMKYLCFAFGIITIVLIILNSNSIENNFNKLDSYLQQNLFFNHSKISVSCVYLSTVNLKWLKHGHKPSEECLLNKEKTWKCFYSDLLDTCIKDIKTQKENASSFYHDFKDILSNTRKIKLDVFNIENAYDSLSIDVNNVLNLLISNGLKLNANLDSYLIEDSYSVYDINSANLLTQTLDYLDEKTITGFSDKGKKDNITEQFTPVPIYLILDCVMFVILIIAFGYLILRLNNLELLYLDKLIKFHSVNFDMYLKRLEDLKKKLRNDTGDDEEKINGEVDLNELNSKIGSKKEENNNNDDDEDNNNNNNNNNKGVKGKKRDKKGDDDKDDGDNTNNNNKDNNNNSNSNVKKYSKNKKKGANRKTKIQQQKNEKRKIMSKYFIKYNIFFTFKVMIVFLLAITYYIVITLVESSKRSDYLSFDSTTNSIEGIYKSSFDIFLNLKVELALFQTNLKADYNNSDTQTPTTTSQSNYFMNIPSNDNISTPKLGNLLMPLVNDLSRASATTNELNDLYNSDTCLVLFNDDTSEEYKYCASFWSSILVKGMEQSITQMGVVVNTVIDELNSLNIGTKAFNDIVNETSSFSQYELFIEYYLFKTYMKTVELFMELKIEKVQTIFNTFKIILICYVIGVVFLFFVLLYFISRSKFVFNTFFNFVGILPVKYLMENDILYKETLKLEQLIF